MSEITPSKIAIELEKLNILEDIVILARHYNSEASTPEMTNLFNKLDDFIKSKRTKAENEITEPDMSGHCWCHDAAVYPDSIDDLRTD